MTFMSQVPGVLLHGYQRLQCAPNSRGMTSVLVAAQFVLGVHGNAP